MASRLVSVVALLLAAAACALANQSPIDIISADAVTSKLAPLSFKHYHSAQSTYYLSNTGHGAQITLKNWLYHPRIKGGPLPKTFVLEQVHFHWGSTDKQGSEHNLNGNAYSMEVHLVHWNSKYASYDEASTKDDGLAVVGFFIEGIDGYKNPDFQKLVNEIPNITAADSSKVESDADLLTWLLPSLQKGGYYTYPGSLTTSPYSENVIWIMYENPIIIGNSQIEPFRAIENHHSEALLTNYRSLQSNSDLQLKYVPN